MGNKFVTGKVRFSYVSVFEPKDLGGELKYSTVILIPKTDVDTYNRLMAEIDRVTQEAVATAFGGITPTNLAIPVYDGDGLKPSGEAYGTECKGHWVLNAKTSAAPEVVDASCNPIINKNEFYSGCYGRASLSFYAYNRNGNKGIGCGLGNVQKLEDGQPLDGRTTAAEDFGALAQITPTQSQYQAPVQQPVAPQYQTPVAPQYQTPVAPQYQAAIQQPVMPQYQGPVDPITGQPMPQTPVNNIYGVS
ncbi:MAG: DUF2815 family protein [Clostridia bacterium]|jgi:hypothetical protein|nr:DUF2815 family protein [Clostridia bacterium]